MVQARRFITFIDGLYILTGLIKQLGSWYLVVACYESKVDLLLS